MVTILWRERPPTEKNLQITGFIPIRDVNIPSIP